MLSLAIKNSLVVIAPFIPIIYLAVELYYYTKYRKYLKTYRRENQTHRIKEDVLDYLVKRFHSFTEFEIRKFLENVFFKKQKSEDLTFSQIIKAMSIMTHIDISSNSQDPFKERLFSIIRIISERLINPPIKFDVDPNVTSLDFDLERITDTDITHMCYGKTQIEPCYKPIIFYQCLYILNWVHRLYLNFKNYRGKRVKIIKKKYTYYYVFGPFDKNAPKHRPILFFHGLGVGIIPYHKFICEMAKNRVVVCPITPGISNTYFKDEFHVDFKKMGYETIDFLRELGYEHDVDICGHSFGTLMVSYYLKNYNIFNKAINLDPICFFDWQMKPFKKIYMSIGAYYSKYCNYGLLKNIRELITYIIVFKDIYVTILGSRTAGSEFLIITDKQYDNGRMKVYLSGKDIVVPCYEIANHLKKDTHTEFHVEEDYDHTDYVMKNPAKTVRNINEYLDRDSIETNVVIDGCDN